MRDVKVKGKKDKGTGIIDVEDLPDLSLLTYFKFLFFVFFSMGFFLLLYCLMCGINPFAADVVSSPFQYFGLGFICFICFMVSKFDNNRYPNR